MAPLSEPVDLAYTLDKACSPEAHGDEGSISAVPQLSGPNAAAGSCGHGLLWLDRSGPADLAVAAVLAAGFMALSAKVKRMRDFALIFF
jgi:hypothetical protein